MKMRALGMLLAVASAAAVLAGTVVPALNIS